jgi:hypothetical protein
MALGWTSMGREVRLGIGARWSIANTGLVLPLGIAVGGHTDDDWQVVKLSGGALLCHQLM